MANERAQLRLNGQEIPPELAEVELRVVVLDRDRLLCSFCSGESIRLGAVGSVPNAAEPERVGIWVACETCGRRFLIVFEQSSVVSVKVEAA